MSSEMTTCARCGNVTTMSDLIATEGVCVPCEDGAPALPSYEPAKPSSDDDDEIPF